MKEQLETRTSPALNRPGYAKRSGLCLVGLVAYGLVLGQAFQSGIKSDPVNALMQMYALIIIGNVFVGSLFVLFTYCRALDCEFGRNGKAWIATVAALPTLALPQYGLLVFATMMLIKSAPQDEEVPAFADDESALPPLPAAE